MTGLFTVPETTTTRPALHDTVQSLQYGYRGTIMDIQEFSYGPVYQVRRLDNGREAFLLERELSVVELAA